MSAERNPEPRIAVILPCYNEEAALPLLLNRLKRLGRELRGSGVLRPAVDLVDCRGGGRPLPSPFARPRVSACRALPG